MGARLDAARATGDKPATRHGAVSQRASTASATSEGTGRERRKCGDDREVTAVERTQPSVPPWRRVSVAFLVKDEAKVGDRAAANAGDELTVGAKEMIVFAHDEPPAVCMPPRLRIERARARERLADVESPVGVPHRPEDVHRVRVDTGGCCTGGVGGVRKRAQCREFAADTVAPDNPRVVARATESAA